MESEIEVTKRDGKIKWSGPKFTCVDSKYVVSTKKKYNVKNSITLWFMMEFRHWVIGHRKD